MSRSVDVQHSSFYYFNYSHFMTFHNMYVNRTITMISEDTEGNVIQLTAVDL